MNPEFPPPNRAIGWYRLMLWMMPTCIALTTAFGFAWLYGTLGGPSHDLMLFGWFLFNTLATFGIASFEVKLRTGDSLLLIENRTRVVGFVLLQLLIIPALSFAIFFAAFLFVP